jgi:hypothetical protein
MWNWPYILLPSYMYTPQQQKINIYFDMVLFSLPAFQQRQEQRQWQETRTIDDKNETDLICRRSSDINFWDNNNIITTSYSCSSLYILLAVEWVEYIVFLVTKFTVPSLYIQIFDTQERIPLLYYTATAAEC